jgi:hypothetical protein
MKQIRSWWLASIAILPVMAACSNSLPVADIEKVTPVSGTLTYQGKPLPGYRVTFLPTDGRRAATGVSDAQGKFTMGTNDAGDGAPPGKHKVAFVWVPPNPAGEPGQEVIIDDPSKLPKPQTKIPDKYSDPETSGTTVDVPPRGLTDLKFDLQ